MESSYYFWQDKIKQSGLRFTGTRKVILETLLKNPGEYDAGELHRLAGAKIGIATIYRTLNLLKKLGIISKSEVKNNKVKYRLNNPSKKGIDSDSRSRALNYDIRKYGEIISGEERSIQEFSGFNMDFKEDIPGNSMELIEIKKMENRMSGWLKELNRLKREKETELESMIKDISGIEYILEKHGYLKSNLIQMLLDVQEKYNWLPKHILHYLGNKLDIPLTNIYSIASFYRSFSLEPKGKHSIVVCMGTACHVRGAMNLLQRIVNILGVKPGDTTGDYRLTLDTVNCLGCCALGPVMMLDNKYYSNPTLNKLKNIFDELD